MVEYGLSQLSRIWGTGSEKNRISTVAKWDYGSGCTCDIIYSHGVRANGDWIVNLYVSAKNFLQVMLLFVHISWLL